MNEDLVFVSLIDNQDAQKDGTLLASSIRRYAGKFSDASIVFLYPKGSRLLASIKLKLSQLEVSFLEIPIPKEIAGFPLASFPVAASFAEEKIGADILVWLASGTMVVGEPSELMLPKGKSLGVRPVHHLLVGSRWDQPVDSFWDSVYRHCGVHDDDLYPMLTVVDGVKIRPYFNSGILVVRPSEGLLRAWRDSFLEAYMSDDFTLFYKIEPRYRIFIHQAILSGTVLSRLGMKKIMQLPAKYNYPLHLFRQDITEGKPKTLDELTTFRFESTYREPGWQNWIPASDDLKSWIISQINEIRL